MGGLSRHRRLALSEVDVGEQGSRAGLRGRTPGNLVHNSFLPLHRQLHFKHTQLTVEGL